MSINREAISKNKSWNTPPKYVEVINQFFDNGIDLDPCSNEYSLIESKVKYILPIDGLCESWNYKNIYVNPPYGKDLDRKTKIYDWLSKGCAAHLKYNSEVLFLIPVAMNTNHFKDFVYKYSNSICFLYDTRLKFYMNGEIDKMGAPMACCIVYFGINYDKFKDIFSKYGKVVSMK